MAAAGGEDVVCACRCIIGSMDSIGGLSLCWLTADWSWFAEAVATRAVLGGLDLGGGLGGLGSEILSPRLEDLGSSPPGLLMCAERRWRWACCRRPRPAPLGNAAGPVAGEATCG
jgi:hypothetical protein